MFLAPVAAPWGETEGTPRNTKFLELREENRLEEKFKIFVKFVLNFY